MDTENTVKVTRESKQMLIRLPDGMREKIAEAAARNGRSMNAEIVAMLSSPGGAFGSGLADVPGGLLLDEIIKRYGAQVQIIISDEAARGDGTAPVG